MLRQSVRACERVKIMISDIRSTKSNYTPLPTAFEIKVYCACIKLFSFFICELGMIFTKSIFLGGPKFFFHAISRENEQIILRNAIAKKKKKKNVR